jgi:hypothetical protein
MQHFLINHDTDWLCSHKKNILIISHTLVLGDANLEKILDYICINTAFQTFFITLLQHILKQAIPPHLQMQKYFHYIELNFFPFNQNVF